MKCYVWKKRFIALIGNIVIMSIILISFIVFLAVIDNPFGMIVSLGIVIFILLILIIYGFSILRHEGSIISFEDDVINCIFFMNIRKTIFYKEIMDYGVFYVRTHYQGKVKFIYISKIKLSKASNKSDAYRLYTKSTDTIVVQYQDKIMEILKTKTEESEQNQR